MTRSHPTKVLCTVSELTARNEELHSAEMPRPGGLHQGSSTSLGLVLKHGPRCEENVSDIGVTVLAGVRQRGVAAGGGGVDVRP